MVSYTTSDHALTCVNVQLTLVCSRLLAAQQPWAGKRTGPPRYSHATPPQLASRDPRRFGIMRRERKGQADDDHPRALRDPGRPAPSASRLRAGCHPWGVRAVGLPEHISAYGVGDTLDEALDNLSEGVRAGRDGPIPDELTREIAVTIGDAA